MDEGDEYVPQMSQLGGDYGGPPGMGGGYPGMMGTPQNSMPSNPYGDPQQMMHPMQPIHPMAHQQQPQQPPAPPATKTGKGRGKKKAEPQMDPMQSMAAMSHNPMMRSGGMTQQQMSMEQQRQHQMMYGGAPTSAQQSWPGPQNPYGNPQGGHPGYQQQRGYPPQGYPQHMGQQMYPGQGQQRPGYPGGPPTSNPYGGYPGYPPQHQQQQYPGMRGAPGGYPGQMPQYPGYPQMDPSAQSPYPGYPTPTSAGPAHNDPRMGSAPQPGMSGQGGHDPWSQQPQHPSYMGGGAGGGPPPQSHVHSMHMELQQCQQRMHQLYSQPRTPQLEQEMGRFEQRIGYLQSQIAAAQQSAGTPGGYPGQTPATSQQAPGGGGPGGVPMSGGASTPMGRDPQGLLIQQHGAPPQQTPVSVTQSGSQVQVNIKPEVPGRTLISVYHQYGDNGVGSAGSSSSYNEGAGKDSVPPEPIPSNQQHKMEQQQNMSQQPPQHLPPPSSVYNGTPSSSASLQNGHSLPIHNSSSHHSNSSSTVHSPLKSPPGMNQGNMFQYSNHNQAPQVQSEQKPDVTESAQHQSVHDENNHHSENNHNSQNVHPPTTSTAGDTFEMDRDAATPPMRTSDNVEMGGQNTDGGMSIMSDETQPALERSDVDTSKEEEEEDRFGDDRNDDLDSSLDAAMDVPPKAPAPQQIPDEDEDTVEADFKEEEPEAEEVQNGRESPEDIVKREEEEERKSPTPQPSHQPSPAPIEEKEEEIEERPESVVKEEVAEKEAGTQPEAEVQEPEEDTVVDQSENGKEEDEEEDTKPEPEPSSSGSREESMAPTDEMTERVDASQGGEDSKMFMMDQDSVQSGTTEREVEDEEETTRTSATASLAPPEEVTVAKKPKKAASKAKKKKVDEDFSGGEADEDFVFETKSKPRAPRKPAKKKAAPVYVDDSFESIPAEFLENEKRRSGRTKSATTKSYAEPRADEFDEEMVLPMTSTQTAPDTPIGEEEDGESVLVEETQTMVVEKFLNMRGEEDAEEFLVKWKGKSYVHCEWKTQAALEEVDKRVVAKIKRFKQKKAQSIDLDDEDFNSDFTVVDRVVDLHEGEEGTFALIKWRSLPYDEVTWESVDIVPEEKIEVWRKRQILDKQKSKEKSRPAPGEWKKIPDDLEWKDGNVLREYQFEGVNWLLYCYYNRQNCILADEMGLGKTVQTITFLSQVYSYGIHGPFLIVVPLSTIHNWVREFETWTDMNAVVYHGSGTARQIIQQNEIFYGKPEQENKLWRRNLVKLDALITTFEMVVTDCEFLKKIPWKVCVIDEAHRLKNRNCKLLTGGLLSFKMDHRVLLTGTPLQNNIDELFSLLNFLHPEQFSSSVSFLEQFGQCQTDEQVQQLQEILKPMMLRRLKEDVEKSLQPREEVIIEVQLSDTQKKYYRAILEKNFSHLCKGANAPALMNVMMELRKCCNHPFLIQGAEEQIISEIRLLNPEWGDEQAQKYGLVDASGKMVLIEKLLPKLKRDGHKVLIFSQMVKVLDLIEEFLVNMSYIFERIDGNVRGDLRQAAIDRFSKPDSDRFVFLLCTRAGGLGINLTAADTVIIFDSDWNPQNDLQAQARCHRIGQKKMVKVYRLITGNTYEREMFDKASLKLGLDKAVLQSTTALEKQSTSLSRKEVEELLKKGAYGTIMDDANEGSKFSEEDIDTILQRRTQTITLEAGAKGSTFSKASFGSSNNTDEIDIDDPNFWNKWAEKANVDLEKAREKTDGKQLIVSEPRKRTKRFEEDSLKQGDESDSGSEEGRGRGGKKTEKRKRRRGADDDDEEYVRYRPDELAFNKSDYFKVEKLIATYGWGRWSIHKEQGDLEVSELDIEHMSRTLLLHCIRDFRGDERTREYVWRLIEPREAKNHKGDAKNKYSSGWAALPEYNPPNFALDSSFQRHVHRHTNKLVMKIEQLHFLEKHVIAEHSTAINEGKNASEIPLKTPSLTEPLTPQWDSECDKNLLIGIYKHGLENWEQMRVDETLCFIAKGIEAMPATGECAARFRRLVSLAQRATMEAAQEKAKWSRREEIEYLRVLGSYGMRDRPDDTSKIDWATFKQFSPLLDKKCDDELQEYLYAVLAVCTKQQGGDVSGVEVKRHVSVDLLPPKKSAKLMNRLHLLRKIHAIGNAGVESLMQCLKLCSTEAMPTGWTSQHDKELLTVCHNFGIDNISANVFSKPVFQKIIRPTEKTLLRRVLEICTTIETGKWNGTANTESIEDSDDEQDRRRRDLPSASGSVTPSTPVTPVASTSTSRPSGRGSRKRQAENAEKDRMKALMQQGMLGMGRPEDLQLAAAMMAQSMLLPSLMGSNNAAASAQLLSQLFSMPGTSSGSSSSAAANQAATLAALASMTSGTSGLEEMLALAAAAAMPQQQMQQPKASTSKKEPTPSTSAASTSAASNNAAMQAAAASAATSNMNINDLFILASLPQDTRIPVINIHTKERVSGEGAPRVKNLLQWLAEHPSYQMDLGTSTVPTSSTPNIRTEKTNRTQKLSTPKPSAPSTPLVIPPPSTPTPTPLREAAGTPREAPPTPIPSTPTPREATPAMEQSPKLEPGEIPKKPSISTQSPSTSSATATPSTSYTDTPIAVFSRSSGALLPVNKWPQLTSLGPWLDKNPDANVHSSSAALATVIVGKSHPDRLGGDNVLSALSAPSTSSTPSTSAAAASNSAANSAAATAAAMAALTAAASASSSNAQAANNAAAMAAANKQQLEALQMQLLIQQSMMQQQLMSSFPYSMGGSSGKPEDLLNNPALLMSMMGMGGLGGGLNSLAMLDPASLAALTAMSNAVSAPAPSSKRSKKE